MENIALIFGGKSTEHDVSVITAMQILENVTKEEFNVLPIFLDKSDNWFLVTGEVSIKDFAKNPLDKSLFKQVYLRALDNNLYSSQKNKKLYTIDACVLATHGGIGENGKLIAFLQMCNIAVSCADSCGQAVAFDKVLSKAVLSKYTPIIDYAFYYKDEWQERPTGILNELKKMKFPLIVKPARQGSSIGITLCKNVKELCEAIVVAFEFDNKIIVEKALTNFKEYNCSALGIAGDVTEISKVCEQKLSHEILTFNDKYIGEEKSKIESSKLENDVIEGEYCKMKQRNYLEDSKLELKIRSVTRTVFRVLNLSGVVRVDFLYDTKRKKLYFNEVNTVPGSLACYFWEDEGVSVYELFKKLVTIAKRCKEKESEVKSEYITPLLN